MQQQAKCNSPSENERIEYVENTEAPDDPCTFVFRVSKTADRPKVLFHDVADLAMIPAVFIVTWLFPPRVWGWFSRSAALLGVVLVPRNRQNRVRAECERVLGNLGAEDWGALRRNLAFQSVGHRFAVAREFSPSRGTATFEIDGMSDLSEGLNRGKGAVLWVNRFSTYPIQSKRVLWQEGVPAFAISHVCHGYSDSRFAASLMNWIQVAAENRYLMQRLVFDDGEERKVQRKTLMLLKRGHPAFITNTSLTGHRCVQLPLGQSGSFRMSTGPMAIALRTGAPLFAVSVFETAPFTRYKVEIKMIDASSPDRSRSGKSRGDFLTMARMARFSRDIILDGIRRYPDQSASIFLDE